MELARQVKGVGIPDRGNNRCKGTEVSEPKVFHSLPVVLGHLDPRRGSHTHTHTHTQSQFHYFEGNRT